MFSPRCRTQKTHSSRGLPITKSLEALSAPEAPSGRDRSLGPVRSGARDLARSSAAAREVRAWRAGRAGRAGRRRPLATRPAVCEAGSGLPCEPRLAGGGRLGGARASARAEVGGGDGRAPLAHLWPSCLLRRPPGWPWLHSPRPLAVGLPGSSRVGFVVWAFWGVSVTSICFSLSRLAEAVFRVKFIS